MIDTTILKRDMLIAIHSGRDKYLPGMVKFIDLLINHIDQQQLKINSMGVKSCNRTNCEKIMCDTYIADIGYICSECQNEFKLYLQKYGFSPETDTEILEGLNFFIETKKNIFNEGNKITVDDFFKQNT